MWTTPLSKHDRCSEASGRPIKGVFLRSFVVIISGSCTSGPRNGKLWIHECFFHDDLLANTEECGLGFWYSQVFLDITRVFGCVFQICAGLGGGGRDANVIKSVFHFHLFGAVFLFVHKRRRASSGCKVLLAWVELMSVRYGRLGDVDKAAWRRKNIYSEEPGAFLHDVKCRVKPIQCFLCSWLMVVCAFNEMKPEGKTKKNSVASSNKNPVSFVAYLINNELKFAFWEVNTLGSRAKPLVAFAFQDQCLPASFPSSFHNTIDYLVSHDWLRCLWSKLHVDSELSNPTVIYSSDVVLGFKAG